MADNTDIKNAAGGSETIADDEITDGGVADGAKAQRVKAGFGPDGAYTDVQRTAGLPTDGSYTELAGTFRLETSGDVDAYDGTGLAIAPTDVAGKTSWFIQYSTEDFYPAVECSVDGVDWFPVQYDTESSNVDSSKTMAYGPLFGRYVQVRASGLGTSFAPATDYPATLVLTTAPATVVMQPPNYPVPVNANITNLSLPLSFPDDAGWTHGFTGTEAGTALTLGGYNSVTVEIIGTFTGTVSFIAWDNDPSAAVALTLYNVATGSAVSTVTGTGALQKVTLAGPALGLQFVQANGAVTSGAANVTVYCSRAVSPYVKTSLAGTMSVDDGGGSLTVDGTVGVSGTVTVDGSGHTQPVSGTVAVSNFPATQPVSLAAVVHVDDNAGSLTVDGTVGVSGTVTVDGSGHTQPVSGTVTTTPQNTELSGTMGSLNAVAVASTDVRGYGRYSIQLSGTWAGTVQVQGSNDNTTWSPLYNAFVGSTNVAGNSLTANGLYTGVVASHYVRVIMTAFTSGTATATLELLSSAGIQNVFATIGAVTAVDTELPAAAALADGAANPTTPTVGAAALVFSGTTWSRAGTPTQNSNTAGTQLPAAGMMGWDGVSAYQRARVDSAGSQFVSVVGTPLVQLTSSSVGINGTPTVDTELPAAGSLSDGLTQPTAPMVGAVNQVYNGATVDKARSATSAANTTGLGVPASGVMGFDGTNYRRLLTDTSGNLQVGSHAVDTELSAAAALADATANPTTAMVGAATLVYNGATWDRQRTPGAFVVASATAIGDTAVYTPTAGKKFRLLAYRIEVTNDAATSGGSDVDITFKEAPTSANLLGAGCSLYVPATGGTTLGSYNTGWVSLGNGILSAAANNILYVTMNAALTAGKARVWVAVISE